MSTFFFILLGFYNEVILFPLHKTAYFFFCPSIKLINSSKVLDSSITAFALLIIVFEDLRSNKHVQVSFVCVLGEGDHPQTLVGFVKIRR